MKKTQRLFLFVTAAILLAANAYAGRWITRDPMEVQEHMERDPHPFLDLNPYTFNHNNPLSFIDPDGLAPQLVSVTMSGGTLSGNYVNQNFGQDYGIGLHGPLRQTPIGMGLDALGKLQAPIDKAEQYLRSSGNPFIRAGGGLLQGVQWVLPEGKLSKLSKLKKCENEAQKTYEIMDGVRRAKAAQLTGATSIEAEILDASMKSQGVQQVPIGSLLSPKDMIDLEGSGLYRWNRVLEGTKNGAQLPPIQITPGGSGIPIINVTIGNP